MQLRQVLLFRLDSIVNVRKLLLTITIVSVLVSPLAGDVFLLRNGGRVAGKLTNPRQNPRMDYRIRTRHGGVILLRKSQVRRVKATSAKMSEYLKRRADIEPTVAGHWGLAEWCKAKSLGVQRDHHLTQILAIDPTHKRARYALGYSKIGGVWSREEERMTKRGLVRFQRGWRTRQEVRVITERQEYEAKEIEWTKKIKTWRSWIRSGRKRKTEGFSNFSKIRDPIASGPLIKLLNAKKEPARLKLMYLDAIGQMPDHTATSALIKRILKDPNSNLRNRAIEILSRYKSQDAVSQLIGKLRNKDNEIVNRAAMALREMRDPRALPALINALTTKHRIQLPTTQPGAIGATFGSAGAGGLSAGGNKPRFVEREIRNESVYQALMALNPGVNFVFDQVRWRRWYVFTNTPRGVNLRRDR